MSDIYSKAKRSAIMSRIRGKGNLRTELVLVQLLRKHGINGWRRHAQLIGRPDFVFPSQRLAVFVDGCFWHGCAKHGTQPIANKSFWSAKLTRNRTRDRLVNRSLRNSGWMVLRIWQHELARDNQLRCIRR